MIVLGLHASFNALSHDPSAALVVNGELVAAYEEERLNRIKTSASFFPRRSIQTVLEIGRVSHRDIDLIVVDGETYIGIKDKVARALCDCWGITLSELPTIQVVSHPESHQYGAFLSSGFNRALVCSFDGLGDGISTSIGVFDQCFNGLTGRTQSCEIEILYQDGIQESLGNFYTTFTNYLGFESIEGEYKVMGMAAYGKPVYDLFKFLNLVDGKVIVENPDYTDRNIYTSIREPSYNFDEIFKATGVKRPVGRAFEREHFDLAASVQAAFEKCYLGLIGHFLSVTGETSLVLSGGCSLNCLANGSLTNLVNNLYVMPAASDRGLAIGNALIGASMNDKIQKVKSMFLGRRYSDHFINEQLETFSLVYSRPDSITDYVAEQLAAGKIVGWFQGRSEFGPRALGGRSILAAPWISGMKNKLNSKIKFREDYRPFAPAILDREFDKKYFRHTGNLNPDAFDYMTVIDQCDESNSGDIAEAVHFDGTCRFQRVSQGPLYNLLETLEEKGFPPAVINTSFNLSGEPIVDSPSDAIRTFFSSGIDVLALGSFVLSK